MRYRVSRLLREVKDKPKPGLHFKFLANVNQYNREMRRAASLD